MSSTGATAEAMTATQPMAERFRMARLESLTGVGREAIRFYIREGLLPEPERPSKTTAWYSGEHVRLLHTIRRLQEDEMLPLSAIRAVLHDVESRPFTERQRQMMARMRQRFVSDRRPESVSRARHKLADLLGLSDDELRQAEVVGFIRADAEVLAEDEERLLTLWAAMRDAGLTSARGIGPRDMAFIVEAAEQLFAGGLNIFAERLGDLSDAETDALLKVIIPNINRIVGILHLRRVRSFVAPFSDAGE